MKRIAYFPHDRPGDALVDVGQLPALRRVYGPCEIVAFCTEANRELFGCLAWCDTVEAYETERAWTAGETASFGEFEAVSNTRHDRDAFDRCAALRAKARYGYETGEVPAAAAAGFATGDTPSWGRMAGQRPPGKTAMEGDGDGRNDRDDGMTKRGGNGGWFCGGGGVGGGGRQRDF